MTGMVALVSGATGVVGRRLCIHLAAQGREVIGLSRRPPAENARAAGVSYLPLDLTDRAACAEALGAHAGITHYFHAARYDHVTTAPEPADVNTAMLVNVLDAIETPRHALHHVHLVEGTKYYGSNLGPFPTPAREDDPRSLQPNFYYDQEEVVFERGARNGWTWSASRPHGICDDNPSVARSIPRVIGVYAEICRELGLPFSFPGTPENWRAIYQTTDCAHLARAITWMATDPRAANQAYNITNGDYFRWERMWPVLAEHFGLRAGPVQTVRLGQVMADKAPVWERIVSRYGLQPVPFEQAALWTYADFVFHPTWDMMSSTVKARQHGFHDVVDSEAMLKRLVASLRDQRLLPPA